MERKGNNEEVLQFSLAAFQLGVFFNEKNIDTISCDLYMFYISDSSTKEEKEDRY